MVARLALDQLTEMAGGPSPEGLGMMPTAEVVMMAKMIGVLKKKIDEGKRRVEVIGFGVNGSQGGY